MDEPELDVELAGVLGVLGVGVEAGVAGDSGVDGVDGFVVFEDVVEEDFDRLSFL